MRLFALSVLALTASLFLPRLAHADVHRCIGANGEPVFTDQPCGTQDHSPGASANGVASVETASAPASGNLASAACPATPQALRDRIAAAFTSKDPNLIAGMLDWRGFDHDSAGASMRGLRDWLKQPLAGIQFQGPPDPSGAQPGDADYTAPDPTGVTVTTQPRGDEAPASRSFGIAKSGGCWWLSF